MVDVIYDVPISYMHLFWIYTQIYTFIWIYVKLKINTHSIHTSNIALKCTNKGWILRQEHIQSWVVIGGAMMDHGWGSWGSRCRGWSLK